MLKAIIVDDEKHCIDHIIRLIDAVEDDIKVLFQCSTVNDALQAIAAKKPDVVFLDVHLNEETAFDLLEQLTTIDFEIVFTTAFDSYAVNAFKFSAVDYLLKPVALDDFEQALNKIQEKVGLKDTSKQLEVLLHNFKEQAGLKKIAIPNVDGIIYYSIDKIIRCQSDANYTHLFLTNKTKVTVAKTLKYFEELLEPHHFFRTHHSHLVNLKMVEKYIKGKGGYAQMTDASHVEIAVRRKEEFLRKLSGL